MSTPASDAQLGLYLVTEVTRGTTPATPAWLPIPRISGGFEVKKSQVVDEVKTGDRQDGKVVGGTVNYPGAFQTPIRKESSIVALLESVNSGAFAAKTSVITGTWTASTKRFTRSTGSFLTDAATKKIRVGDVFTTTNSVSNNGTRTVTAVTANYLTFSESCTDESAVATTFTSTNCRVSASGTTRKFFSFLEKYADISLFERFMGQEVDSLSLTVNTTGVATMDWVLVGTGFSGEDVASSTFSALAGTASMSGTVSGTAILLDGAAPAGCVVTLQLTISNARTAEHGLGSADPCHISEGSFKAEVSFSIFFTDDDQRVKYVDGDRFPLEFKVIDEQDGHAFIFSLPEFVYQDRSKGKQAETIVEQYQGFAERDSLTGSKLIIEEVTGA